MIGVDVVIAAEFPGCYVLRHPFDLTTLDIALADGVYDSRAEAEYAAAAVFTAIAGTTD